MDQASSQLIIQQMPSKNDNLASNRTLQKPVTLHTTRQLIINVCLVFEKKNLDTHVRSCALNLA